MNLMDLFHATNAFVVFKTVNYQRSVLLMQILEILPELVWKSSLQKKKLVLSLHHPYIHIDKIHVSKRPNHEKQYALKSNSIKFPHRSESVVVIVS